MSVAVLSKPAFKGAISTDKIPGRLFFLIALEADFNKMHSSVYTGVAYTVEDLVVLLQRLWRLSQELYTHIVMHVLGFNGVEVCHDMKEL